MESNITKLYDAALKGETYSFESFLNFLKEDKHILDQCIIEKSSAYTQSPLHLAANAGHKEFTKTLLHQKPELAEEADQVKRWSALHMASAKADIEIVDILVRLKPTMCLARDKDGLTPIHVAALERKDKEEVEILELHQVLEVLHDANNCAAQERTNNGETILHLCVKHGKFEALKKLIQLTDGDGDSLINSKDNNGNTILHLAVTTKQPLTVKYLLQECESSIEINALNNKDMTVADVYKKQSKRTLGDSTIERFLKRVDAERANDMVDPETKRLENQRSSLMVVASLIATMAFQVGINPPGGFWQEFKKDNTLSNDLKRDTYPGTAILSYYDYTEFFVKINTVGFVSSISVIMLLIGDYSFKSDLNRAMLRLLLWLSVILTSVTYFNAVNEVTYNNDDTDFHVMLWALALWEFLMLTVAGSGYIIRFVSKKKESIIRKFKNWFAQRNTTSLPSLSTDLP